MKSPAVAIKEAYQTLLTDSIDFSGSPVKFRIGEGDTGDNNNYIILSNVKFSNNPNKGIFISETSVTLDIYSKEKVLLSDPFNSVDVIEQKIFDLVLPSITTTGLEIDADFQIQSVRLEDSSYSPVESVTGSRIMKKQIVFIHNIIEK